MQVTFKKDFISVIISKILIVLFGLSTTIIVARTLGPEKNGIIASLLVFPLLFISIGSLGVRQSTAFFLGKSIYSETQLKRAIIQLWAINSLISMFSCFFLIKYFVSANLDNDLILISLIPIPFSLFNTYNTGLFLGKNQIQTFSKVTWFPKFILFILTLGLVVYLNFGIRGYLISLIGGPVLLFCFLIKKNSFIEIISLEIEWDVLKRMFLLGGVYALALLIINLNYKIDIILLDYLSTQYQTGIYSKGAVLAEYIWEIPMLISTIVFSRSATSKSQLNFSKKVVQLLRLSLLFVAVGLIVLYVFSEIIVITIFGIDYFESVFVLQYLIPGVFFLTFFKITNMDVAGRGKPIISMKAMLPALILNILLNFIFIPYNGAIGASLSSTISYSFASFVFLHLYSVETGISVKEIFNYQKKDFIKIIKLIK